jgi:pantoate--beta-alanine ligase
MGSLHEGHLSLVRRAKTECGAVAVTIFVNPTQFAPGGDFENYPRALLSDLALLESEGVDLVFTPPLEEMYPEGFDTAITVGAVSEGLEGKARPGHFTGVATVVAKLFNILQPTRAYFGRKDAQQVAVIQKLVRDLDMPVEIVAAKTVRAPDGLALSSRNAYLRPEERAAAPVLHRALEAGRALAEGGELCAPRIKEAMLEVLQAEPLAKIDYVSLADPSTLREIEVLTASGALASLAVRIGKARLIDNLHIPGPEPSLGRAPLGAYHGATR